MIRTFRIFTDWRYPISGSAILYGVIGKAGDVDFMVSNMCWFTTNAGFITVLIMGILLVVYTLWSNSPSVRNKHRSQRYKEFLDNMRNRWHSTNLIGQKRHHPEFHYPDEQRCSNCANVEMSPLEYWQIYEMMQDI